jgi:hypothetical protein
MYNLIYANKEIKGKRHSMKIKGKKKEALKILNLKFSILTHGTIIIIREATMR